MEQPVTDSVERKMPVGGSRLGCAACGCVVSSLLSWRRVLVITGLFGAAGLTLTMTHQPYLLLQRRLLLLLAAELALAAMVAAGMSSVPCLPGSANTGQRGVSRFAAAAGAFLGCMGCALLACGCFWAIVQVLCPWLQMGGAEWFRFGTSASLNAVAVGAIAFLVSAALPPIAAVPLAVGLWGLGMVVPRAVDVPSWNDMAIAVRGMLSVARLVLPESDKELGLIAAAAWRAPVPSMQMWCHLYYQCIYALLCLFAATMLTARAADAGCSCGAARR